MEAGHHVVGDVAGPCSEVVGHEDDEAVVPPPRRLQLSDEAAHTRVGIGEGIERLVAEPMIRHIKRLMRTGGLYDGERRPPRLLGLEVGLHTVEEQMVGHTPLAQPRRQGEVLVLDDALEALVMEERPHIGEVGVATIIILQIVTRMAEMTGQRGQRLGLTRIFHQTHSSGSRVAEENGDKAAVGAESVGIEAVEIDALSLETVQLRRHTLHLGQRIGETLHYNKIYVGP